MPMKLLMVLDLKHEKWLHEISVNFETRWLMSEASLTSCLDYNTISLNNCVSGRRGFSQLQTMPILF